MSNKLFEDIAIVAGSAFTTLIKANQKLSTHLQSKIEPYLNKGNAVSREEYESLLDMIVELQQNQKLLLEKIDNIALKLNKTEL